jgi:predicted ATPase
VISDHELQFLSERFRALPSFMQSRVHEEFAEDFLQARQRPGSPPSAARAAVNYERRNLDAWETLIAANAALGLGRPRGGRPQRGGARLHAATPTWSSRT